MTSDSDDKSSQAEGEVGQTEEKRIFFGGLEILIVSPEEGRGDKCAGRKGANVC